MPHHILILSFLAWGHLRPECNLAVMLAERCGDLTVSFIVDTDFQVNAQGEINRAAGNHEKDALERIRVISAGHALKGIGPQIKMAALGTLDPREHLPVPPDSARAVREVVHKIMDGENFVDENGRWWEGLAQKPDLVICDMFMAEIALIVKEQYHVTSYFLWAGCAGAFGRLYGSVALGGQAEGYVEACDRIEADPDLAKGRTFADISKQVYAYSGRYTNDVVKVKGLRPFYEWEDFPQNYWPPGFYWTIAGAYPFIQKADGILIPSIEELDAEGFEGIREWCCGDRSCAVLAIGPLLSSSYLDSAAATDSVELSDRSAELAVSYVDATGPNSRDIDLSLDFLSASLRRYGAGTVLYISFGTIFAPQANHIRYLFEVLLEMEVPIPFLFAAASPILELSDDLKKRVEESRRGLIVDWAPQQSVILHPATGFVMSHCGAGGATESLCAGVPIIAWPQGADQPRNARWLSEVLDVAFELLQVRICTFGEAKAFRGGGTQIIGTEEAIKNELRDVLAKTRGEEGQAKRANAREARRIIQEARKPGGSIDRNFGQLLQVIGHSDT